MHQQPPGWGHGQPQQPQQGWQQPPPQYGYPPQAQYPQPPPQQGISVGRILAGIILIPIIAGTLFYVARSVWGPHPSTSGPGKFLNDPAAVVRSPEVLMDEDLVVPAGGYADLFFTLPSDRPVQLTVSGKQDTGKGYNVYLMRDADFELFKARKPFEYTTNLSSQRTGGFDKTAALPAGKWNIVVHNSENILNRMTVHVKVVVDP